MGKWVYGYMGKWVIVISRNPVAIRKTSLVRGLWFMVHSVKRRRIFDGDVNFKSQISNCIVSLLLGEHARLSRKYKLFLVAHRS